MENSISRVKESRAFRGIEKADEMKKKGEFRGRETFFLKERFEN
jgi:hypothetical protein